MKRIYVSNAPLTSSAFAGHDRCWQVTSAIADRVRVLSDDQTRVRAVLPDGSAVWNANTADHDGPYEAAQRIGSRLIYDYSDLKYAVMFDVVETK